MGSSLLQAVNNNKIAKDVTIIVNKDQYIKALQSQKISASMDYKVTKDADLVIICSNLESYKDIIIGLNQYANKDTIITDIGSVKIMAEDLFDQQYKYSKNFVPAHPIAGSERSGFGVIIEDLYTGKKVIITRKTKPSKLVAKFYKAIGMDVEYLASNEHDQIFAEISHLPQLLAFECRHTSIGFSGDLNSLNNIKIQKFMRLGDSNKDLWDEIFSYNMVRIVDLVTDYRRNYQENTSYQKFSTSLRSYQRSLCEFDLHLSKGAMKINAEPIQQIIVSYLDSINPDSVKYAGSGFMDFIQPIFE
jgi:prephenate dehydrogenase